jgi:hypothetical protein
VFDTVDVGTGKVVETEMVQRANAPGNSHRQASSNEMEVETLKRMGKRWEGDQSRQVAVTDQDLIIAKVIRESRWNVRHEYTGNYTKRRPTAIVKDFQWRSGGFYTGSESALGTRLIAPHVNLSPVTRRLKYGRTPLITIAATTQCVTIQGIRAIRGRKGT